MEMRTVALWSHLGIEITNVKAKQLLLLFTAYCGPPTSSHSPNILPLSRLDGIPTRREAGQSQQTNSALHWLEDLTT